MDEDVPGQETIDPQVQILTSFLKFYIPEMPQRAAVSAASLFFCDPAFKLASRRTTDFMPLFIRLASRLEWTADNGGRIFGTRKSIRWPCL